MKNFATLTARGELMYFTARDHTEANYICGGGMYKELDFEVRNLVKNFDELHGVERELYKELNNL